MQVLAAPDRHCKELAKPHDFSSRPLVTPCRGIRDCQAARIWQLATAWGLRVPCEHRVTEVPLNKGYDPKNGICTLFNAPWLM